MPDHAAFALETYARRAFNYLDRMVDADGLPYFDVFWQEPAEAAHDWPDFGDVMTRALQGAVMARRMTGQTCVNEERWLAKALGYLEPANGLLTRPATGFSEPGADPGDYCLTLYAFVTVYDDNPTPEMAAIIRRMVDGFPAIRCDNPYFMGFAIKGLMAAARSLNYAPAIEHAAWCARLVTEEKPVIQADNTYPLNGHMHSYTRAMVGLADYALYTKDPVLFSRVDAAYRFLRKLDPGFGFLPEVVDRQGDIIACETCALMDYVGLGVTLANHGHPEYWGGIERLVRNHLAESQAVDNSWLVSDDASQDTEQFSHRQIGERMVGAYAGWSSPTHILACREELHWGGPELRGKIRAFQNCCGGSGTHAYYIAWKSAARFADGTLSVNLHIDKRLPQAEIRCDQPYAGRLTVRLDAACDVRLRLPDFCAHREVTVAVEGRAAETAIDGNYAVVRDCRPGDTLTMAYPLAVRTEKVTIGNRRADAPASANLRPLRRYRYRLTWKGDTVVAIDPAGPMPRQAYSDFESRKVEVYYGEEGPGRLYQRAHMLDKAEAEHVELAMDDGGVEYWAGL